MCAPCGIKRKSSPLFSRTRMDNPGSPFWYSGFEVGGVKDIRIAPGVADRIAITVKISPEARVRRIPEPKSEVLA